MFAKDDHKSRARKEDSEMLTSVYFSEYTFKVGPFFFPYSKINTIIDKDDYVFVEFPDFSVEMKCPVGDREYPEFRNSIRMLCHDLKVFSGSILLGGKHRGGRVHKRIEDQRGKSQYVKTVL
jgi:hypothetical protein